MKTPYALQDLSRALVDTLDGITVLEFGTDWCGHCSAAQPAIATGLAGEVDSPPLRHLKVEDGPGRALGRSFRVKLWPTLVFLRDGQEVARLVRPASPTDVASALALAAAPVKPPGSGG